MIRRKKGLNQKEIVQKPKFPKGNARSADSKKNTTNSGDTEVKTEILPAFPDDVEESSHEKAKVHEQGAKVFPKKKHRHTGHPSQENTVVYVAVGVVVVIVSFLAIYFSGGQPTKNKNTKKPVVIQYISLAEAQRMYDDGIRFLQANKYKEADQVLRKAKDRLLEKRDASKQGTKEYADADNLLTKISEAHYQAYKNIKLDKH